VTVKKSLRPGVTVILALLLLLPATMGSQGASAGDSDINRVDSSLRARMAGGDSEMLPVIVEMEGRSRTGKSTNSSNEDLARQAYDLLRLHGQPVAPIPLINAAAGFANARGIQTISRQTGVKYIYQDTIVQPRRGAAEPETHWPPGQLTGWHARTVKADQVWLKRVTGRGITVAVLDSGVAPDIDLTTPTNRLLASVNFADELGIHPDPGGHGTHVAGIIAGSGSRSKKEFVGIAPGSNIVDVRVLNRDGNGRISSVVRGIEWVLAHQYEYNIRVINLSVGAPAWRSYQKDPMAAAVEIAWMRGVTVVVAAGNGGPASGTVESPGIDPFVITVGALDDLGTYSIPDDELAWFSAWGWPTGSTAKPDLIAPGRRIVSIHTPGSYLDTRYPERRVVAKNGVTYFRLTGTSMATAVVSGVVALLLEDRPHLSPNEIKAILVGTTQPYGQSSTSLLPDESADGAGLVDAFAAFRSPVLGLANQGLRPADLLARALYPVLYGQPLVWKDSNYLNIAWDDITWDNIAWDNVAWDNIAWDSFDWSNVAWDNVAWDNVAWDNIAWDNIAWDNVAWDSLTLD
jgi:serine protease AprX